MKRTMRILAALTAALTVLVVLAVPALAGTTLRRGDRGGDVTEVQTRLRRWGYYMGNVDGIFGPQTEAGVRYFQRRNGLAVDGIVGPKTAAAIGIKLSGASGSRAGSRIACTAAERELMAKVVYAEARGEPYAGKVAVAAVIINRVLNKDFPNTISGVIYQRNAFSCIQDGQINLTPDSTARQAVRDALAGSDPSRGALYFYNPKISTSQWIFTRTTIITIGNHRFAR